MTDHFSYKPQRMFNRKPVPPISPTIPGNSEEWYNELAMLLMVMLQQ